MSFECKKDSGTESIKEALIMKLMEPNNPTQDLTTMLYGIKGATSFR
jgi:hypothetical protein